MGNEIDLPPLSVEARLKDYISTNIKIIESNIVKFGQSTDKVFNDVTNSTTTATNAINNFGNNHKQVFAKASLDLVKDRELRKVAMAKTIDETETVGDKLHVMMTKFKNDNEVLTQTGAKMGNTITASFMKLIPAMAGVASAGFLISKLKEGYEAAREMQRASIQLTAGLGYYSSALNEQSSSLAKLNTMERSGIVLAQERLANYVKDEDQIKRLIPAIMNLAAAKGINLATAANIVGVAIESNSKTLGRYGISLDGVAGSTEKIESAIAGLNKRFKGQQDALNETIPLWDKAKLAVSNYFEETMKYFTVSTQQDVYEKSKKLISDKNPNPFASHASKEQLEKAAAFVEKFEAGNREARFYAQIEQRKDEIKREEEETSKLRENYLKTTNAGKLIALREEMAKEIDLHAGHEDQIKYIKLRYAQEIKDLLERMNKKEFEVGGTGVGKALTTSPAVKFQKGTNEFNVSNLMAQGQQFLATMAPKQTEEQIEMAHRKYLAFESAMLKPHANNLQQLKDMNETYYNNANISYETYLKNKEKLSLTEVEIADKKRRAILSITESETRALMEGYEQGTFNAKKGMKAMLSLAVDYIEKWALAAVASNTLQNETSMGYVAGTIVSIAEAAAIVAGAAVAKGAISSFETGTRDAPGGLAYVHKDEMISLPAHSQVYTKNETKNMMGDNLTFNFNGNTDSTTVDKIEYLLNNANRTGRLERFKSMLKGS
jgi:hypothetical protein